MDDSHRISITICGDGGCGKSSITLRLVRGQWTAGDYDPTIEDSYSVTRRLDGQTFHLAITDTAGQEEYRGLWTAATLRADAFLLVYDITNPASLAQLADFNALIDIEAETRLETDLDLDPDRPFASPIKIVAGNKCDLQAQRLVPAREGLEWARAHGCGFMETSARDCVNIEETFALMLRRVVEARRVAWGVGVGRQAEKTGTMRAVTAPLSPLPRRGEKGVVPAKRRGVLRRARLGLGRVFCLR